MNIPVSTAAPASKAVVKHIRRELYSGRIPESDWAAAERFLERARFGSSGAIGGSIGGLATGRRKARGNKAHYAWLVACREAKRAGMPQPPKPEKRGGKAKSG
jgi:hypothetical protein